MYFTEHNLHEIAQRLINIERAYLHREGIDRKDDYPPQKVFLPLVEMEGVREEDKHIKLDKDKYEAMLDEYYLIRGWTDQGIIKEETRQRLSLDEEIDIV